MKKDFNSIHQRALKIAANYLRSESDLIDILQEVDECKGYRELEFKSLSEYAIQALKLSESVAYNLIAVARKAKEVPQLQDRIRRREITLSNARTIAPVLTPQNQERWLLAAATLSKHKLEKQIAAENPKLAVPERITYVSEKRLEFKIGISEELHEMIVRTQELVSSRFKRHASLEDALKVLAEFYLDKEDPIRKAERANARAENSRKVANGGAENGVSRSRGSKDGESKSDGPVIREAKSGSSKTEEFKSGKSNSDSSRPGNPTTSLRAPARYIPAELRHRVILRDQGQCTYRSLKGVRCQERRWLDTHHILPLSQGGETTFENLTTLCRGHHQMTHALMSPVLGQVEDGIVENLFSG